MRAETEQRKRVDDWVNESVSERVSVVWLVVGVLRCCLCRCGVSVCFFIMQRVSLAGPCLVCSLLIFLLSECSTFVDFWLSGINSLCSWVLCGVQDCVLKCSSVMWRLSGSCSGRYQASQGCDGWTLSRELLEILGSYFFRDVFKTFLLIFFCFTFSL